MVVWVETKGSQWAKVDCCHGQYFGEENTTWIGKQLCDQRNDVYGGIS